MTINGKQLLCTLGPSSFSKPVIRRLAEIGATLFRINLSHTSLESFRPTVELIRDCTDVPICVDTEGAQIRTGKIEGGETRISQDTIVEVTREAILGDAERFSLYPGEILGSLEVGDIISIDFNSLLVQVLDINPEGFRLRVLNGGLVGQNKACPFSVRFPCRR